MTAKHKEVQENIGVTNHKPSLSWLDFTMLIRIYTKNPYFGWSLTLTKALDKKAAAEGSTLCKRA